MAALRAGTTCECTQTAAFWVYWDGMFQRMAGEIHLHEPSSDVHSCALVNTLRFRRYASCIRKSAARTSPLSIPRNTIP